MGVGIVLIIAGIIVNQLEGVLIKKYNINHKSGGFIFTGLMSLFAMIFFVITNTDGFYFPPQMFIYAVSAGILYCLGSFCTFIALGCGPYAMSMLILSYSIVFKIGYGLMFLSEPATVFTYIGFLVIFISIYLTRMKKDEKKTKITFKWIFCVGISVCCSGIHGVISKMQQVAFNNSCDNEYMIIALGISAVVLLVLGIIKDLNNFSIVLKYGTLYASGAGIANGISNMTGLIVNKLMPVSLSSPLGAGLKIIVVFMISKFLFKEKFLIRQIIGVFLGALALVLLNIK